MGVEVPVFGGVWEGVCVAVLVTEAVLEAVDVGV